jgi:ribosomal protein S18 acetylase RimI-like enzyme
MEINYREINTDSFTEVRYFFVTHEYSWRDSDPESFTPKTEEMRDETAYRYIERLKESNEKFYCLGAFFNGELVGSHFLDRYKINGKDACHIHGLWVDSRYRGQKIAFKLKELGELWAKSKGCELMDSNVKITNESMIKLNKKMGYEVARYNFRKLL